MLQGYFQSFSKIFKIINQFGDKLPFSLLWVNTEEEFDTKLSRNKFQGRMKQNNDTGIENAH
jgi:hypothetical protein